MHENVEMRFSFNTVGTCKKEVVQDRIVEITGDTVSHESLFLKH